MNLICEKNDLLSALTTASRAMAVRSTVPVLEGICLSAQDDVLKLTCTDTVLSIETLVPSQVEEKGAVVLPGRLFSDIVRRLPDGQVSISSDEKNVAVMRVQGSRTKLQGLSAMEFPSLPPMRETVDAAEIRQDLLKAMIRQSTFAVALDETRPILTGALFEIDHYTFSLVALDGFRLALRKGALASDTPPVSIVVPGRSLSEIGRILEESERNVSLLIDRNYLMIDMEHTRIITRLLEGEFIKYKQLLPSAHLTRVRIGVPALTEAIERASLMAREGKNNMVRFSIKQDQINITSNSEMGDVFEEVPCSLEGNEMEIAFNVRYFGDLLKCLDCEEILMDCTNSFSQCVIRPIEGEDFLYLVLPVRIFS